MKINLSESIKRLRKAKNMTQEELACSLDISAQAVSRWETVLSYPDVELLPKLAAVLNVSLDELFCIDAKSEEFKISQYRNELETLDNIDEQIKLTKKYIDLLPSGLYPKTRLLLLYKAKGLDYSKKHLPEMRDLCLTISEHCTGNEWYRAAAINVMIAVENEDNLDMWLSMLDNKAQISSDKALSSRYLYRGEIDKYNMSIQEDIVNSLTAIFERDFCKRDNSSKADANSRVEGQKCILKIIDSLRDPRTDHDAWLGTRAFAYMRLAVGEFGTGNTEAGNEALEKSVDLYLLLFTIPDDTKLIYNCSSLDMISVIISSQYKAKKKQEAMDYLSSACDSEWMNSVKETVRFKKQFEKIKASDPESQAK